MTTQPSAPFDPTGQSQAAAATRQQYAIPGNPNPGDPGNINAPANPAQAPSIIQTTADGSEDVLVVVNGRPIHIYLNQGVKSSDAVKIGVPKKVAKGTSGRPTNALLGGPAGTDANQDTVLGQIQSIQDWYGNVSVRNKIISEMYAAGLVGSKKSPSANDVTVAWSMLVQEAALQNAGKGSLGQVTPEELLSKAAQSGWNSLSTNISADDGGVHGTGNINNSTETSSQSETIYKSYVDPATAMGTLADAYYRLMGRNPKPGEYQAFLDSLYGYQDQENTGKFESKTSGPNVGNVDPATGQPVDPSGTTGGTSTQTNVVSQRGIGTRGVQFLAGQQALASPEEGSYQAATTYFNAFVKALSGPAAGMQASGPTTTVP